MGPFSFPLVPTCGRHLRSSIGLEVILAHTQALTTFTQQALNDSWQSLPLPDPELSLVRKAVLQNKMASVGHYHCLTRRPLCVIQTECCVFTPDGLLMCLLY